MIVDKAIYRAGHRQGCGDLSAELDALRAGAQTDGFIWIGLKDPTDEEFELVNSELHLHPLAVEDAVVEIRHDRTSWSRWRRRLRRARMRRTR